MKTTLNEIKKHNPYPSHWAEVLVLFNKTKADNEPIDFMTIREILGIKDAVWYLRTQAYRDYCLFLADAAELVLPIFEAEYPHIIAPRRAIEGIRAWYNGDINNDQLNALSDAAFDAASNTYVATYTVVYGAVTNAAAYAAVTNAAAYAAGATVYATIANAARAAGSDWEK
ncbi:MAG: hypothetical protein GY829_04045, partial [Gammaproteobacteria bacterium]|nr:hypothetical protein [Gammaproteobacteria bacterium]